MTEIIVEASKLWKPELAVINGYFHSFHAVLTLYSLYFIFGRVHAITVFVILMSVISEAKA